MTKLLSALQVDGDGAIFLHILIYLDGAEISRTLTVCRTTLQKVKSLSEFQLKTLWDSVSAFSTPSPNCLQFLSFQMEKQKRFLLNEIRYSSGEDGIATVAQYQSLGNSVLAPGLTDSRILSERLYALNSLKHLRWDRILYESDNCPFIERMEGHAAVSLNQDNGKWTVIINGWGPQSTNEVYVIDNMSVDIERKTLRTIPTKTSNNPRFRYGFSVICTEADDILVYGGCSVGGYSGECSG